MVHGVKKRFNNLKIRVYSQQFLNFIVVHNFCSILCIDTQNFFDRIVLLFKLYVYIFSYITFIRQIKIISNQCLSQQVIIIGCYLFCFEFLQVPLNKKENCCKWETEHKVEDQKLTNQTYVAVYHSSPISSRQWKILNKRKQSSLLEIVSKLKFVTFFLIYQVV